MHAWQPPRMAAVLTEAEETGLTKSEIARISGVHRSQVSRWFSGEQRPGYDPAMRLAGYLEKELPELAPRFMAAAGYGGPVDPEPDILPEGLREAIDDEVKAGNITPQEGAAVVAAVEATLRGEPLPSRRRAAAR